MLARWTALLMAPYLVVPLMSLALILPSLLLWFAVTAGKQDSRLSNAQFGWGLLIIAVLSVTAWLVGNRYGARLATRRAERLTAFLSDPGRG
jgi:hypothetical protein